MTQIKTPEQIATDTEEMVEQITKRLFEQVSHGVVKGRGNTDLARITWWGLFDQIEAAVHAGIEADRVQRSRVLDALHTWAVDVSYSLSTDKSNDWSEELDELASIERFYGLVDEDGERL